MKKKVKIASILIIIFMNFFYSASAAELCKDSGLSGDANRDGILDVSDAVEILTILFIEGVEPCLQEGDANGDGSIDIGDPIYLLNFLFQGGPAPQSLNGEVLFFEGSDDAPDITLSLLKREVITELPIRALIFDSTNEPGVATSEHTKSTGDIAGCEVIVSKDGRYIGTTFTAVWPDGIETTHQPIEFDLGDGGDGVKIPDALDIKEKYTLEASCTDLAGQTGNARLEFETQKKKEIPPEPNCREGVDVCYMSTDEDIIPDPLQPENPNSPRFDKNYMHVDQFYNPHGTHYVCVRDCDAGIKMKEDGTQEIICNGPESPGGVGPLDVIAGYDSREEWGAPQIPRKWNVLGSDADSVAFCNDLDNDHVHPPLENLYCPSLEEVPLPIEPELTKADTTTKNIQLLVDEPSPSGERCYVDSVKIVSDPSYYKNNIDDIQDLDIEQLYPFVPQSLQSLPETTIGGQTIPFVISDSLNNDGIPLGPVHGWVNLNDEVVLAFVFGFLVVGDLEKGSMPEKCLHVQYAQTLITEKNINDKEGLIYKGRGSAQWIKDSGETGFNMETKSNIFTKSLRELKGYKTFTLFLQRFFEDISLLNAEELNEMKKYCITDNKFPGLSNQIFDWCPDSYHTRGLFLHYLPPVYVSKDNIVCTLKGPRIIWLDTPGALYKDFNANLKSYKDTIKTEFNIISAIEDSEPRKEDKKDNQGNIKYVKGYQYRWLCTQEGLSLINGKLPDNKEVVRELGNFIVPKCNCQKQRRLPGENYVNDGDPVSC